MLPSGIDEFTNDTTIICENKLVIDEDLFAYRIQSDSLMFVEAISIDDGCLQLNLGYSGCNSGHDISLITNGYVAESQPPQVQFRMIDNTTQLCQAAFLDSTSYDLTPLEDVLFFEGAVRLIFPDQGMEILWER